MNDRTCIVTRRTGAPDELIRFVAGPESSVVPDLKRKLPGRGCWVTAERSCVEKAARKNLFSRALRAPVVPPDDLGGLVESLLSRSALGALGLARKAGAVALGAAKVEAAVRSGRAIAVLHALEASEDGMRKITAARRATVLAGGPDVTACQLFSESELSLAFGGTNVIHAALLDEGAGAAALKRVVALDRYRGGSPKDRFAATVVTGAAEDTE